MRINLKFIILFLREPLITINKLKLFIYLILCRPVRRDDIFLGKKYNYNIFMLGSAKMTITIASHYSRNLCGIRRGRWNHSQVNYSVFLLFSIKILFFFEKYT